MALNLTIIGGDETELLISDTGSSIVAQQAEAARDAAEAAAASADADAIATAADRVATGQDRVQTGLDRTATAADRAQTGLDVIAADADAAATAADRVQTGLDRVQTGLDRDSAAGSAVTTAADRIAASSSASAAAASVPATADRTVGRRLSDTGIWSMIRATPIWGIGVTGVLEETPIDTLRWEFDPLTLAPYGAAFAGARSNQIRNPRAEGSTTGTITASTPSTGGQPTNWYRANSLTGITFESLGPVSASGRTGHRYRVYGTQTAGATSTLEFEARANLAASAGMYRAAAAHVRVVSSTVPLASMARFGLTILGLTSGNAAVTNNTFRTDLRGIAVGAEPVQYSVTALFTSDLNGGNPVAQCGFGIELGWNGNAWDITFDVLHPRCEVGPFASAPILPVIASPAVSARAQGTVTIPVAQFGTRWNRRQGILICEWNSQPGPFSSAADGDWFGLISWGDTTANERLGLLVNPAHTSIEARVTAGGVVQAPSAVTITAPSAGTTTRAAVAWDLDAGFLQAAARGVAGSKVALSALPIPGNIMPGRYATSHPLFGRVPGLEVRPAALFDAALAVLT